MTSTTKVTLFFISKTSSHCRLASVTNEPQWQSLRPESAIQNTHRCPCENLIWTARRRSFVQITQRRMTVRRRRGATSTPDGDSQNNNLFRPQKIFGNVIIYVKKMKLLIILYIRKHVPKSYIYNFFIIFYERPQMIKI